MGSIDWLPIEELPEEFKDGRDVLLWAGDDGAIVSEWLGETWVAGAWLVTNATHFAEINAPEASMPGFGG